MRKFLKNSIGHGYGNSNGTQNVIWQSVMREKPLYRWKAMYSGFFVLAYKKRKRQMPAGLLYYKEKHVDWIFVTEHLSEVQIQQKVYQNMKLVFPTVLSFRVSLMVWRNPSSLVWSRLQWMRWSAIIRKISNINLSPVKYDLAEKNMMPAPESRFFPGLALCFHR